MGSPHRTSGAGVAVFDLDGTLTFHDTLMPFLLGFALRHPAHLAGALAMVQAHRAAGDHLVLLSASPDLYVPSIGEHLAFERTVCTEIRWDGDLLNGELRTSNRRGTEKVRCLEWLRTEYPGAPIVAYGNSESDLPHMQRADRAVLVNANRRTRRLAAELGIATADWK